MQLNGLEVLHRVTAKTQLLLETLDPLLILPAVGLKIRDSQDRQKKIRANQISSFLRFFREYDYVSWAQTIGKSYKFGDLEDFVLSV
jgi:hypothetical protein